MRKYEAMFIIRPDLSEDERKALLAQINDVVAKNGGEVTQGVIWLERRKLAFPIRKYREGAYYLLNFNVSPEALVKINYAYKLNEGVLRVLVIKID